MATDPEKNTRREELLKRMGIKDDDFSDYLRKLTAFLNSLNSDQRRFYDRNNARTFTAVAKSLGPDVTLEDIKCLLECAPFDQVMLFFNCCKG